RRTRPGRTRRTPRGVREPTGGAAAGGRGRAASPARHGSPPHHGRAGRGGRRGLRGSGTGGPAPDSGRGRGRLPQPPRAVPLRAARVAPANRGALPPEPVTPVPTRDPGCGGRPARRAAEGGGRGGRRALPSEPGPVPPGPAQGLALPAARLPGPPVPGRGRGGRPGVDPEHHRGSRRFATSPREVTARE